MKTTILLLFALSIANFRAQAQTPNLMWAKSLSATAGGHSVAYDVVVDATGNVYTIGTFMGQTDFDPGPGTFTLNATSSNMYISKLSSTGAFVWAKSINGLSSFSSSIALDAAGNVYATGSFTGTADFDPGTAVFNLTATGTSINNENAFVLKLNSSGAFVWARQFSGTVGTHGECVTVDAAGNVYSVGNSLGVADYDPGPGTYNLGHADTPSAYISKLNSSGSFVWAKHYYELGSAGQTIVVDASGAAYVAGGYVATCDFDLGPATFNLTAPGFYGDIYILKLDASGGFVWAKGIGSSQRDRANGMKLDASGDVVITGTFEGPGLVDFDPGPGTANLTGVALANVFVLKLTSAGAYVWAKGINVSNTPGTYVGPRLALDASGGAYVAGAFTGTVDFDPGASTANLTAAGAQDGFALKLNSAGSYLWAIGIGGAVSGFSTSDDVAYSVATDATGQAHIVGIFRGTADFDPGPGTLNITAMGNVDAYVLKLAAGGATQPVPAVVTSAATAVTTTSGTLNGTINAAGELTTDSFQYGLTTAYGTTVVATPPTSTGTTATAISKVLTGLTPGTLYHYRAKGTNSAGAAFGTDQTFTTLPTTGIGNRAREQDVIVVFPNPATNIVTLVASGVPFANATVRLQNLTGQTAREWVGVSGKEASLEIAALPAGMYVGEIAEDRRGVQRFRLVKQ